VPLICRKSFGAYSPRRSRWGESSNGNAGNQVDGFGHGALPDARNTALIHASMLPRLLQIQDSTALPQAKEPVVALSYFAQELSDSLNE
jgi:hypothetical protein